MAEAIIISIGDELTGGEILNTNAAYTASELTRRGIRVELQAVLPDDRQTAAAYLRRIMVKQCIYVLTGGLGGTQDDLTRQMVGESLGRKLCIDRERLLKLKERYRERNRVFQEADLVQVMYPEGGSLLENQVGLAYGFYIQDGGRAIFALPGVPTEMKCMFDREVIPTLEKLGAFSNRRCEVLTFSNIAEYVLDRKIAPIVKKYRGLRHGTRSGYDLVRVVVESGGESLEECIAEIERALEGFFVVRGEKSLEETAGELLLEGRLKLAVAESCTAGLLSKVITDVSGSSGYFMGGIVSYSNDIKRNILGVEAETLKRYGAVSSETAEEMARRVQELFMSNVSLSITGIAGPEGGTEEKPVGTVYICLFRKGGAPVVEKNIFYGDRTAVRARSVSRALSMLVRSLREVEKV